MKRIMILILIIMILIIGCTKEIIIERNNTKIEYIYNTTIKEVFINCNCTNETIYIGDNCLPLIRQIKRLENIINKWALLDINITINETNTTKINDTNSS